MVATEVPTTYTPQLDETSRGRVQEHVDALLRYRGRAAGESSGRAARESAGIVASLELCAVGLVRQPDEPPYVGPATLFSAVVKAAGELRSALETMDRQRAAEEAYWNIPAPVARDASRSLEVTRMQGELCWGSERPLNISIENLQDFLSTLVLLADAPTKSRWRGEDQERALLDSLVLNLLETTGLPCVASIHAALILAELHKHAFGDPLMTRDQALIRLRYANHKKRNHSQEKFVLTQRAIKRLSRRQATPDPAKK